MGSAALAGAAFIVGVVVGWLLRPSRRGAVLTAFRPVVSQRKERETTILVCGFGSAPTDADVPANVLRCLADLQQVLSGIVGDEGGTVDRFAGDRLIAVFAAKRSSADHAGRAVEAAKRIASNVGALSRRLHYDLRIAIGIHSGSLPLDDRGRVDAVAIGDAIDVAGRLEVYAKGSDVTIALTESVAERAEAEEAAFDLLGEAAVGSEGLPVRVFAPRQRR